MRKRQMLVLLIIAVIVACGSPAVQETKEEIPQKRPVRKMSVKGVVAKAEHGYIIRGKVPSMIFTILNPIWYLYEQEKPHLCERCAGT